MNDSFRRDAVASPSFASLFQIAKYTLTYNELIHKRRQILHVRQRGQSGHVKISWAAAALVETAEQFGNECESSGFDFFGKSV